MPNERSEESEESAGDPITEIGADRGDWSSEMGQESIEGVVSSGIDPGQPESASSGELVTTDAAFGQPDVRPWLRPALWLAGAIGLILIGAAGAQLLFPRTVVEPGASEPLSIGVSTDPAQGKMPDLLGLDEATARRVIADAGLASEVSLAASQAAGPVGVIVAQHPLAGTAMTTKESVVLTLSTQMLVPDSVLGANADDARKTLEALGAVVRVTRTVDPGAEVGAVLAVEPGVGQPLPSAVVLTVADPGQAVSLTELTQIESSRCSTISEGTVNGSVVKESVSCSASTTKLGGSNWVLARQGVVFEATVGVLDRGDPGSATVRLYADDILVKEIAVAYGTSTPISVDVRGVLRLRLEVGGVNGTPTVVLGDGRLLGTQEQVATLVAAQ